MLNRSGANLVNPGPKQQSKKSTGIKIIEASSDETLENMRLTFQDLYPLFIGITETWLDSSISDAEIEIKKLLTRQKSICFMWWRRI